MSIEYAILFLAVLFGAYVWTGRALSARGAWRNPARLPLWHAVFSALAGFAAAFIGLKWLENNSPASALPGTLSARELSVSLAAALVSGAVGFWKARRLRRESPSHLGNFLEDDAEWAETIFSAGLMASVLMIFFLQAFKIPSSSMEKTLLIGDHLFVNKFLYGLRVPVSGRRIMPLRPVSRGDIAVFQFPDPNPKAIHCGAVQAGRAFIKRVIGLPGDTIEVREGRVYVNGALLAPEPYAVYSAPMRFPKPDAPPAPALYQKLWEDHTLDQRLGNSERDYFGPVKVPPGSYFLMGDNRDRSCDSRYWGPVPLKDIEGKAWFIYWPLGRAGLAR